MPQLIVRNLEDAVVRRLKKRAGEHGISMEEEHRRILREALLGKPDPEVKTFWQQLAAMPDAGGDGLFSHSRNAPIVRFGNGGRAARTTRFSSAC